MESMKSKAKRLINVLEQYREDPTAIRYIAHGLNYLPEILAGDLRALVSYIADLEKLGSKK